MTSSAGESFHRGVATLKATSLAVLSRDAKSAYETMMTVSVLVSRRRLPVIRLFPYTALTESISLDTQR